MYNLPYTYTDSNTDTYTDSNTNSNTYTDSYLRTWYLLCVHILYNNIHDYTNCNSTN